MPVEVNSKLKLQYLRSLSGYFFKCFRLSKISFTHIQLISLEYFSRIKEIIISV